MKALCFHVWVHFKWKTEPPVLPWWVHCASMWMFGKRLEHKIIINNTLYIILIKLWSPAMSSCTSLPTPLSSRRTSTSERVHFTVYYCDSCIIEEETSRKRSFVCISDYRIIMGTTLLLNSPADAQQLPFPSNTSGWILLLIMNYTIKSEFLLTTNRWKKHLWNHWRGLGFSCARICKLFRRIHYGDGDLPLRRGNESVCDVFVTSNWFINRETINFNLSKSSP